MDIEAVVLTGGSSRRMGADKSMLLVGNVTLLDRTVAELRDYPTTVLGPGGVPDSSPGAGPLAALAAFEPRHDWVFIVACDLPLFDGRLVALFRDLFESAECAVPLIQGRLQPLCGLYSALAMAKLREVMATGESRIMAWLERLDVRQVDESDLTAAGINPYAPLSANTPGQLSDLLAKTEDDESRPPWGHCTKIHSQGPG